MTKKQFAALSETDSKILLYFFLLLNDEFEEFNLVELRQSVSLTNLELFSRLKVLFQLNFFRFYASKEAYKIYVAFDGRSIDLKMGSWKTSTIVEFNEIMFKDDPKLYSSMVFVYQVIGKFDAETMNPYLENGELPDIRDFETFQEKLIEEESKTDKIKAKERRKRRAIAQQMTKYFYGRLSKKIAIVQTNELIESETRMMTKLMKRYPEVDHTIIQEGIDYFTSDAFWVKIILSVTLLTKHFPQFLINQKGLKKAGKQMNLV